MMLRRIPLRIEPDKRMANFFQIAQVRLQSLKNIKYNNETGEIENKFKVKQFEVCSIETFKC